MTFRKFGVLLALGAALALSAACSEAQTIEEPVAAASPADARARLQQKARAASLANDAATDKRPAFTGETVRKLNPIVERAMLALDRFDALGPQLAAAREAGDKPRIAAIVAELGMLKASADAAHVAFQAEKKALLTRDEYHDPTVLAAMEQFVAEAPREITEALAAQPAG